MAGRFRTPSPALIVAMIALVAALAGSAIALPGKNSVDKNDIKKNAVKSKAIKNAQVKAADLATGSVKSEEIADGAVGAGDIAPAENFHAVGAPGEPAFFNGGEGDCIWTNGLPGATNTNPAGFYKDVLGRVHLRGVVAPSDGPGGDGVCDPLDANEIEDGIVFVLPSGYRTEFLEVLSIAGGGGVFGVPDAGALINTQAITGGAVLSQGSQVLLDGASFRPPNPAAARAGERVEIDSLRTLRRLGG